MQSIQKDCLASQGNDISKNDFVPHLQEINTSLGRKAHVWLLFCVIHICNSIPVYLYVHVHI